MVPNHPLYLSGKAQGNQGDSGCSTWRLLAGALMRSITAVLLFCAPTAEAWAGIPTVGGRRALLGSQQRQLFMNEEPPTDPAAAPEESAPSPPAAPAQYDVSKLAGGNKQEGGGSGFNQFDPVMTATGFISRRFGLVGGLAVVGLLAVHCMAPKCTT